jgi:hypothetical protein
MGLTIHYKLAVDKNLSAAVVRELAQRTARYAQKIGCAEVGEVMRVEADTPFTPLFVSVGREEDCCFGHVPAKRGWVVDVAPGDGCESALFGLCQYPRRTPFRAGSIPTGFEGGWLLKGHCKTQYAGEHGWEHFLKCHRQIISLLDFWRQLGVMVEVTDEGEYWQTRSEEKLRNKLQQYDGLVAVVAGTLKDAADETDEKHSIESPIFARKDFERLEAEGQREFGRQMAQFSRMGSNSGWFAANRTETKAKGISQKSRRLTPWVHIPEIDQ